jgi:hypothetical protein
MPLQANEEIVTKPMHTAAQQGLAGCMSLIERLAAYEAMGFPLPDIRQVVDEWQPRFNAVIEQYAQQRMVSGGR